ncbi:hypothetical protein K3H35_03290 [Aeromonas veronii]|uniref:hypothetical protein n=1 Tax=Aeromonas veronii TaxID=654 RepID=UPI001F3B737D|nr:hypothetical protein [Aeromonas veronii]MCF5907840.1 hypothetical protein [Aeromonas veronii]
MKQIPSFKAIAENIEYLLWVDGNGELYVQFDKNTSSGTFSKLLFSVSKYASQCNSSASIGFPDGFDLSNQSFTTSKNNNDGGFLKTVLCHLLT